MLGVNDWKGAAYSVDLKPLPPPTRLQDQAGGPGSSPRPAYLEEFLFLSHSVLEAVPGG